MSAFIIDWPISSGVFVWFFTTLVQVTLIAGLVLLVTRFVHRDAAIKHRLLMTGLLLIVIAPATALLLQQAGLGVIAINDASAGTFDSGSPKPVLEELAKSNERVNADVAEVLNEFPDELDGSRFTGRIGELGSGNRDVVLNAPFINQSSTQNSTRSNSSQATDFRLETDTPHEWFVAPYVPWWKSVFAAIILLWLIGSCVRVGRWFVAWIRLQRMLGLSVPLKSKDVKSAFESACGLIGCNPRSVRLVTSSSIATPVVAGILRPTIVIPDNLLKTVSAHQLVQILLHELAHIVRRDQFALVLQQLAGVLYWAHPLVEHMSRKLAQASEEICDNHVLKHVSSNIYSQTLLLVAEFATSRRNPAVTIGVMGNWSLHERIAELLDKRRVSDVDLKGRSKLGVAMHSLCFGAVLFLTFETNLSTAETRGDSPSIAQEEKKPENPNDSIRGTGDQLEFRLRGRLQSGNGQPLVNPTVSVRDIGNERVYAAVVVEDRYEVWLPANSLKWFTLSLDAKSDDGQRNVVLIARSNLRAAITDGVDIRLESSTRLLKVLVMNNGKPVTNAHIRAIITGGPLDMIARSDTNGEATFKLNAQERLSGFTAWTDSGLLGGYQFHQAPPRDPNADEHVIELVECQERRIRVVDTDGAPVVGVRLRLQVATPDHFNYLGNPTDSEVVTDSEGTAHYRWFPRRENIHHYAELVDQQDWLSVSQSNTENAVEMVVKKPAKRVQIKGQVSRGGEYVGGVVVEARSFQGEENGRSDSITAITDNDGNFSFGALPNSTYSLIVLNDRWVSVPNVFTPVDPVTGEKFSPYLMAQDGQLVTIRLTSGSDRVPIAGQIVSLVSEHPYSWKEKGEKQTGVSHRQIFATTNEDGLATAFVPLGTLRTNVYTSSWRSETQIEVAREKVNLVELHRDQAEATQVNGQIVLPPSVSVDFQKVSVKIQSIDGQTSEEFAPAVNESGGLSFSTKSSVVGCFAYSADGDLAAATVVDDFSTPFTIKLLPAAYLSGTIRDGEGKPVINHRVSAEPRLENSVIQSRTGFSSSMKGQVVTTKTDLNGSYRLGPLPNRTRIGLWCATLEPAQGENREDLGNYFIEPGEQRPPQLHRLGTVAATNAAKTTEETVAIMLRDARLGGFHAMFILANYEDENCSDFVRQNLLDYDDNVQVSNYMQMRLNVGGAGSEKGRFYALSKNWPLPEEGCVVAVAVDANGKELGCETFQVSAKDVKALAKVFVEKHLPAEVDARQKWDEAFAVAKKSNRRVWVRIGQRYCGPCHMLNRWIDDHCELLEKEFVMLKIDDVRALNGQEIANTIANDNPYSIPFFAFYDADQEKLMDSVGPTGNVGFVSGFEGKRHFRKMLENGNRRLTDEEIARLLESLAD